MKRWLALATCVLLAAADAGAADIAGKWGIGAAVFNGGEVSLIRGHSARTAWLFDVGMQQESVEAEGHDDIVAVFAGPGVRRFARPGDSFSPYWDVRVRGGYLQAHDRGPSAFGSFTNTTTSWAATGQFGFGLEYFTSWHFSVAVHSDLAQVSYEHRTETLTSTFTRRTSQNSVASAIRLSPALYARVYF